jgi:site-specific recombinase XerD
MRAGPRAQPPAFRRIRAQGCPPDPERRGARRNPIRSRLRHQRPLLARQRGRRRNVPAYSRKLRLRSSASISALTQKLLNRAGISIHRMGADVLRHSLATTMVIGGVSFKTVADVLEHQSLATTEIYAKLDVGSLSQVAMPWPGGAQ